MQEKKQNSIVIYRDSKKGVDLKVPFRDESVWLNQAQIGELFKKDQSVISRHISKIFLDKEVDRKSNMQKMHIARSDKPVVYYSLDVVLAVGYKTNSKNAIQFRKWATSVLKKYLLEGYAINEKRLREAQEQFSELQETIVLLQEKSKRKNLKGQSEEILSLLGSYARSLTLLEQFDKEKLSDKKGRKGKFVLNYKKARAVLESVRADLVSRKEASELFASERGEGFQGIIGNVYQTFSGKELYPSVEIKAAHFLYFIIKDHPFSDGNKRSGSFLFVYFLDKNDALYKKSGEKKINDNALTALALLVAESDPKEKDLMIKLIVNLIVD